MFNIMNYWGNPMRYIPFLGYKPINGNVM